MTARPAARLGAVFTASSIALVLVMGAITWLTLKEESAHARAEAEARFHEDVRAALWRMEARVSSMLALFVGSFTGTDDDVIATGDTLTSNRFCVLDNALTEGPALPEPLRERAVRAAEEAYVMACGNTPAAPAPEDPAEARANPDFGRRNWSTQQITNFVAPEVAEEDVPSSWTIGPAAPLWSTDVPGLARSIVLARRIESPKGVTHRADILAWDEVRTTLLAEIDDLFPGADLEPIEGEGDADVDMRLAALPVRLSLDRDAACALRARTDGGLRPLGLALGAAWLALVGALWFGRVALRASVAYGDKHRRFTHAVTHELRTPLTTFRMYSEMLSRDMVQPEARAEYLATLERESARLTGLVENVLRYAQLEEGAGATDKERIALDALVERAAPDLARIAEAHGATLEVAAGHSGPVLADTDAVRQILTNLVENACKYGLGDARVVRVETSGPRAIDVVDSGPGIDPRDRALVFEPFERAGRTSADPRPGVGLGLALSRDLARALGGDLGVVASERGEGARFRLTLTATS